ncbi:MAG TPA: MerR family transcriptional regulator [Sporichthya sp.]|nr:MerR family transcriptional regulator [Sporichthya sp.]
MSAAVPAGGNHLSIGEVLACLRPDFPDLTISKIRFYEAAGLVEPARTPAGYRKFSTRDVERLRYVLTAKHDHYLPLRVIRDQLEAIDAGQGPLVDRSGSGPGPHPQFDLTPSDVRLTREQMLAETGLDEDQLAAIDESGLLQRRRGGYYDTDDVLIATIAAELGRFGLEPRHLRAFKGAADREVGLVEQAVVAPNTRRRGGSGLERSRDNAAELATRLVRLHAALLQAGLRHTLSP